MGIIKFNTKYVEVDKIHNGEKLFQFLVKNVDKKVPKSAIMKWIRTGQVRINGKRAKPFVRLKEGEKVRIPPHYIDTDPIKEDSKNPFVLKKLFENEDFLVLEKPPNLCVQPGKKVEDSVYDRLKLIYGNDFYLVHRLDKETSGLLLVAKNYSYLQYLQHLWKENLITKVYLAWISSSVQWENWKKLEDELIIDDKKYPAVAYAKTIIKEKEKTLVAVKLQTGRKHQIRIQLAKRGYPVIGDKKYGHKSSDQGLLLHASYLSWDNFSFLSIPKWKGCYKVKEELILELTHLKS